MVYIEATAVDCQVCKRVVSLPFPLDSSLIPIDEYGKAIPPIHDCEPVKPKKEPGLFDTDLFKMVKATQKVMDVSQTQEMLRRVGPLGDAIIRQNARSPW